MKYKICATPKPVFSELTLSDALDELGIVWGFPLQVGDKSEAHCAVALKQDQVLRIMEAFDMADIFSESLRSSLVQQPTKVTSTGLMIGLSLLHEIELLEKLQDKIPALKGRLGKFDWLSTAELVQVLSRNNYHNLVDESFSGIWSGERVEGKTGLLGASNVWGPEGEVTLNYQQSSALPSITAKGVIPLSDLKLINPTDRFHFLDVFAGWDNISLMPDARHWQGATVFGVKLNGLI